MTEWDQLLVRSRHLKLMTAAAERAQNETAAVRMELATLWRAAAKSAVLLTGVTVAAVHESEWHAERKWWIA